MTKYINKQNVMLKGYKEQKVRVVVPTQSVVKEFVWVIVRIIEKNV